MFTELIINGFTLIALPFLYGTALFRRAPEKRPKIVVIQLGGIADMVCTTPLLRTISTHDSRVHITVLCRESTMDVLKGNPCIDETVAVDAPEYRGLLGQIRLLLALKRSRFTVSLAVLPGTFNAVLGMWTCAPVRVHTRGAHMSPFGYLLHVLHTDRVSYKRHTRTYVHYMNIAELFSAPPSNYRHEIYLSDAEREAADVWLRQRGIRNDTPFAILALSAENPAVEWPLDRFLAVASHLLDERRMPVLFTSPDPAVTRRATTQLPSIRSLDAGGLPLRMLAAIIERATLLISVDSGPLYIAYALGTPIVDIIGPVDPEEQTPPKGLRVELVLPATSVAPSVFVGDAPRQPTEDQRKAVDACSVDMVVRAMGKFLDR